MVAGDLSERVTERGRETLNRCCSRSPKRAPRLHRHRLHRHHLQIHRRHRHRRHRHRAPSPPPPCFASESPCHVYADGASATFTGVLCQKTQNDQTICRPRTSRSCPSDMYECSSNIDINHPCTDVLPTRRCEKNVRKGKCNRRARRMLRKCASSCRFCCSLRAGRVPLRMS